jgi:hypothetical protein
VIVSVLHSPLCRDVHAPISRAPRHCVPGSPTIVLSHCVPGSPTIVLSNCVLRPRHYVLSRLWLSPSLCRRLCTETAYVAEHIRTHHISGSVHKGVKYIGAGFAPLCAGPYVLGPYVLGPYVLGPYVLGPYVLGPYVLGPYALGPLCNEPLMLSRLYAESHMYRAPIC